MEHRDQIKNELSSKKIFLQNSLAENEKPAIYSLEAEFARTKKNRDLKPYLIFCGFILLLIGITLATVRYLEHRSKQVNIDISDFEDLRLKEALGEAIERGEELNRKNEELSIKDEELKKLQLDYRLEVQRLKEGVGESGLRADPKEQERFEELQQEYERQYALKQLEISRLQAQTEKVEERRKSSQQNLEAEIQEQKEYYERKIAELREANSELEVYQYALGMLLKDKKASGCVTDPRQRKNILIFSNQKVRTEVVVDLYRAENIYVGKIKLIPDKNGVRAETVEVARNDRIKPLDWFRTP